MQGRPKSFKTLNVALPIKRDIDENLAKLELQKRHLLALQRQETGLKQRLDGLRKQCNQLRNSQSGIRNTIDKAIQQSNVIYNVDRTQQQTLNSLNQTKTAIDLKRRQVEKFKKLNKKLTEDHHKLSTKIADLWQKVEYKEEQCERLKRQLIDYRSINHKNNSEYQKSFQNLTRSEFKIDNSRKKSAVMQVTFWGQQMKQSMVLSADRLSQSLRNSGIFYSEGSKDIMTESVPLAKHRVAALIHANRQKLRISDNYRRFCEGLDQMFSVMKNYKGRDDIDFIAQQFVAKERQIQKLQEYVSTVQGNITLQQNKLAVQIRQDQELERVVKSKNENQIEKYYQKMNDVLMQQISNLQEEESKKTQWFHQAGQILQPLLSQDDTFNRANAIVMIGEVQQKLKEKNRKQNDQEYATKNNQNVIVPNLDLPEGHNRGTNQLLNYQKMKEFAQDFLRARAN